MDSGSELLKRLSLMDVADIAIVSSLLYFVWTWFKRTKAAFVAIGMFILAGIYILARVLNLVLTAYLLQGFFAAILLALIVIFQEEIRHFFERIAVWSLGGRNPASLQSAEVETLVLTLGEFSREHIGALIVLRGKDPLERHISEGFELDGKLSEALLKSIFDPHSDGHDGAAVIQNDRIERFGVHLPISKDVHLTARLGTRHAAALTLSELTDALCLIVSEERGRISVAQNGKLTEIENSSQLQSSLEAFLKQSAPSQSEGLRSLWRSHWREKAAAVALSIALWFLFVQGSKTAFREYEIPIVLHNTPAGIRVASLTPERIRATLAGLERNFYLLDSGQLKVHLDLSQSSIGEREYLVGTKSLPLPENITLMRIEPPTVRVSLSRSGP